MGNAAHVDVHAPRGPLASRRLLRLAGDDRLVAHIRRGSEAAFEVAFERHGPGILAFCHHMLGSREEAEDAVQHTFAAAYRDLQHGDEREILLKPWLFTIARNRCLSVLRARRELPQEHTEVATAGLADQVEQRAEVRELLADIRDLPDEQRAALLLAEVGGLAQADIASVLGCEAARVKALMYRARSGLIARRDARELPCEQVREQLSELRGGSLRRTELQLHLRECAGCREFREQVKRQRQMLAVSLPVAPTLGLKSSVLGAVGIGGGAAAGGVTAGGAAVGGGAALAGVAKVAAVALIAAGGTAVVVHEREPGPSPPPSSGATSHGQAEAPASAAAERSTTDKITETEPGESLTAGKGKRPGHERANRAKHPSQAAESAPGQLKADGERAYPVKPEQAAEKGANGRGPIEAPPPTDTPVRRGPPEPKLKEQAAPKVHTAPGKPDAAERPTPKLE